MKQKITQTRVDEKSAHILENPPHSFIDVLNVTNRGNLLLIRATFPIRFSEAERETSGITKLKTAFRNSMKDDRECNLKLLQIQTPGSIKAEQILEMFIKKIPRRLFSPP